MNLLVIDKNKSRGMKISKVFLELNMSVFHLCEQGLFRVPDWVIPQEGAEKYEIALIHKTDSSLLKNFNNIDCTIFYTGGDPAPEGTEWDYWIQKRPIEGSAPITRSEAESLIEWINNNKLEDELPDLLLPPKEYDVLPALSILCQGFLASHNQNPSKSDIEVKTALDRMGWTNDFIGTSSGQAILENVRLKELETESPNWWLDLFTNVDIEKKVKEENKGKVSEYLSILIKLIANKQKITDVKVVAKAFIEISKILKGDDDINSMGTAKQ